jgi:hypothetical protein
MMPFWSLISFHRRLASVPVAAAYLFLVRSRSHGTIAVMHLCPRAAALATMCVGFDLCHLLFDVFKLLHKEFLLLEHFGVSRLHFL